MHSVDILEDALRLAMNSGVEVRQEWLNEKGGGLCRIGKRRVLFVDLSLTASEQLEQVLQNLRRMPQLNIDMSYSDELVSKLSEA